MEHRFDPKPIGFRGVQFLPQDRNAMFRAARATFSHRYRETL